MLCRMMTLRRVTWRPGRTAPNTVAMNVPTVPTGAPPVSTAPATMLHALVSNQDGSDAMISRFGLANYRILCRLEEDGGEIRLTPGPRRPERAATTPHVTCPLQPLHSPYSKCAVNLGQPASGPAEAPGFPGRGLAQIHLNLPDV